MFTENLRLADFDYCLPKELIAQYPGASRDSARMLVLERKKRTVFHKMIRDVVNYFSRGDCLVLNNTKVIWARIIGRREKISLHNGGGKQEIFLLQNLGQNIYRVLAKPAKKLTVGTKVLFDNTDSYTTVLTDQGMAKVVEFSGNGNLQNLWQRIGQVPLPPYIKREPEEKDKERYQTVYAKEEGSCACPTAGLHFTQELLELIGAQGVNIVDLTLHINYSTFAPVKCADIKRHKMHKEYFILPQESAEMINAARAEGKKIFAVGTTSARVLEACAARCARKRPLLSAQRGWTDLFIYPPYRFKIVDCLLTNFHFPKSTLLMLVSAFAGRQLIFKAYQEAIEQRYRFFSYGDAMLIL